MYDLRLQIFGHLQRLSIPYFDRHPVGRLMTRVTSDVETLNELFSSGVVTVFGDVFTLGAIMIMMLATDWRLALVAFAVIPAVWLTVTLFRRSVRDAFRDIRIRLARLNAYLQEHLSGVRIVQLFGRERAASAEFRRINADHLEAHLRSITIYAIFFPVVEALSSIALALLLWYGGLRTLGGTLTVGVLAAFIQLTRRFFQPLQDLSEKFNLLQSAMASSERVFRLLDEPVTIPESRNPRPLSKPNRGEVAFEGVWFRYAPDAPWVLKNVSFTARPGETVALVGHTGAGKTTVVSLLLRFYDPERGRITIDGVDIRDLSLSDLRGLIGFVQQDLFLFTGDILHNLTLDAPVSPLRAEAAAHRGRREPSSSSGLPAGLWTVLGENSCVVTWSVGERSRYQPLPERVVGGAGAGWLAGHRLHGFWVLERGDQLSGGCPKREAQIQRAIQEADGPGGPAVVVAHRLSQSLTTRTRSWSCIMVRSGSGSSHPR
jgi:ABC-type multidrug transport system fused ATPase/permease subunit